MGFVQFVLIIAAMQALGALGIDAMLPNLPAIGSALGVRQENRWQLIITCYMLGFGGAQVFYGPMADRFGRRPVLMTGLSLYVLFSLAAALSRTFEMLLFARGLQGIGAAAVRTLPISIVRDCYSGRNMARVMSLASMVFMGVPVMAPTLGQAVILVGPWPLIFVLLAVFGAGVLAWALARLPETLHPQDRLPIAPARISRAYAYALTDRTAVSYTLAQTLLFGSLLGFINSVEEVFADVFHAAAVFPLVFGFAASFIAVAALLNARLLGYITVAAVHLAIALSGRETLVTFAVCQALTMFAFGLTSGNFSAMAMEPMGHIAGVASSLQGLVSTIGGAAIGFLIGQQFHGTVLPVVGGYLVCGLLSLGAVMAAEKGRLFRGHFAPAT